MLTTTNAHRTAISRKKLSGPMRFLSDTDMILGRSLDYGCGKGFDADTLGMDSYDPHYRDTQPSGLYDTITCNYVLNVIPNSDDRDFVLNHIRSLLTRNGVALISVRNDKSNLNGWTSRGTWQGLIELDLELIKTTSKYKMYLMRS